MPTEINRLSREFVWWELTTENDLATATAEVAILADPTAMPADADWQPATLVGPTDDMGNGSWWTRLLVGPGGDRELAAGTYQTWLRITASPERPVRRPGVLEVL